jgi:hypothetical protein
LGFIEFYANFEANCSENKLKTDKNLFFSQGFLELKCSAINGPESSSFYNQLF